ncbi:Protein phosphatase Slingshot 2 [Nymphon striatum]|nr:Protein phosphatase Slingshot 2 [Nymphon striatum]
MEDGVLKADEEDTDTCHMNSQDSTDLSSSGADPMSLSGHLTKSSDCYFAVKGAAVVLPTSESMATSKKSTQNSGDLIQEHLHNMLLLLQPEDTLKMAVKLESMHQARNRYLAIVSRNVGEGHEECCLLGFDCNASTAIGLVLPIWATTVISLDGDGGFSITSQNVHLIMKPISVQAMWSALQSLHRANAKAQKSHYFFEGMTHSWVSEYEKKIESDRSCLNEWVRTGHGISAISWKKLLPIPGPGKHFMEDIESRRPPTPDPNKSRPTKREETEIIIRKKLKEIMMSVDLDEVTCKFLRVSIEEALNMDLRDYRKYIDEEMLTIFGQLDAPTMIFDYLYLGSEWNASNLEELKLNGITDVLNVTREIDNFFPGMFNYVNIRVYDEEKTDLLKYWDKTFKCILKAKNHGKKCLVHCKMGKSRSASVVIAYVMKAYNWSLAKSLDLVKKKRNCINPNDGFIKQLTVYEGILDASRQRHSTLWRSKSETDLTDESHDPNDKCRYKGNGRAVRRPHTPNSDDNKGIKITKDGFHLDIPGTVNRPKSWSPSENITQEIFPKSAPSSPGLERKMLICCDTVDGEAFPFSLQRGASIRDRIFELESQKSVLPKEKNVSNVNRSGLVLNLATQFEGTSKPNTPSPVDEQFKDNILQSTEVEPPVISQTKPPANKHEAVLIKPVICSIYSDFEIASVQNSQPNILLESQEPLRSTSTTSIDSGVSCHINPIEIPKSVKNVPCKISEVASSSDSNSMDIGKNIVDLPSPVPMDVSNDVIKSASSSAIPSSSQMQWQPISPDYSKGSVFTYEKEDIPWTPGTVRRTKEQLEQNTLKRTKSFDSALKLKSGKHSQNADSSIPVQRSQSLSVRKNGMKSSPDFVVPPTPPIRTTSINRKSCVVHSASSPSLCLSSNASPQFVSSMLISESKLHPHESDEGLVMSMKSLPYCNDKASKKLKNYVLIDKDSPPTSTSDEGIDYNGVVRRLTQELEAKSRMPNHSKSDWMSRGHSAFRDCRPNQLKSACDDCLPSYQRRTHRFRIKSENIPIVLSDQPQGINLQRSSSAGSVSQSNNSLTHKSSSYFNQPIRIKSESSPLRVITSQNMFSECNQNTISKPPPAKGCRKNRKHQQDYGRNHPVNKIVSRAHKEATAFKSM